MRAAMAVQAALILPVLAAVVALVLEDGPGSRTAPAMLMLIAAGAAGTAGVLSATGHDVRWQSFDADAWRGLLAAGALLVAAASVGVASASGPRGAVAVGAGTAAGSLFAPDLLGVGLLLIVSTAAFAVASIVGRANPSARLRSLAPLAVSDALALIALSSAAGTSLVFAPLGRVPGTLLLVAAAIRLMPLPAWLEDAEPGGTGAAWLGAARAQGALLAMLAVAGQPARASALMTAGAVVAAVAAARLMHSPGMGSLLVVPGAIAAAGIGFGGAVATAGAAVTLVAAFAAGALAVARRPSMSAPVLAFAPAGAALLGFALTGGAIWRVAAARPEYVSVAIALAAAAGLAAVTAWRMQDPQPEPLPSEPLPSGPLPSGPPPLLDDETAGDDAADVGEPEPIVVAAPRRAWAPVIVAAVALIVAVAPAFAPMFAYDHGAAFVAAAAGAPRSLTGAPEVFSEGLGIAIAALVLVGLLAGGRIPGGHDPAPAAAAPRWMRGWAAGLPVREASPVRAAVIATGVVAAVGLAFAVRLILVSGGRGWL